MQLAQELINGRVDCVVVVVVIVTPVPITGSGRALALSSWGIGDVTERLANVVVHDHRWGGAV